MATADDGTFEVASLLPGTYKLRISGEGFVDAWYPAAGTAPARQAVDADEWVLTPSSDPAVDPATQASLDQFIRIRSSRVQPVEDAEPIEIVLDGQPATLVGILSAASGDLGTTPEVTAIKVRERSDDVSGDDASGQPTVQIDDEPVQGGAADAGGLPGSAASGDDPALPEAADSGVVDGDPQRFVAEVVGDTFTFTDLPAPGTYLVTISDPAEGYQPQSFQQEVNGGDNTVLNPVQLAASSGIITGKVVGSGAASAGLGDVTVTARSGDVAARVTTPTTGSVGNYEIRNLPTPGTYVVTFERDGFSSRTIAVELAAGATWPVEDIRLAGGNGIIVGTAVSAVDGAPLGGLSVSVEGDAFRSETSTLTSGAGAGGFRFEELPIPADCADPAVVAANCTYTVTISGDSLSTEAVTATFSSAGTETLGNITMSATISQVGGTVQVAGASAGGVSVTLSSGAAPTVAAPRITTTVAEPAGVFSFDEVPPGSYTLEFRRSDLVTRVILLRVRAGENVTLPITLTTVPPPMEVT